MEVFRFNIIPTEEFEKREKFRLEEALCDQCGTALEFSYQQLEEHFVLQEDSQCPHCNQQKQSRHRVH